MRQLFLFIFFLVAVKLNAQQYDLLIKGGRVIDARNKVDGKFDVAITGGMISKVAKNIATNQSKKIIDATGFLVTPGLIDIHTHVFVGGKTDVFAEGTYSVSADDFSFKSGVTTVVDAGTSGWRNFPSFKTNVIDKSQTRILAFLNIAGSGMSGKPDQENVNDMDVQMTYQMATKYSDDIVGIKIGHYEGTEWTPFDRAHEAAHMSNIPMLVECHLPNYSLEDQLNKLRAGDIITHSFEKISERASIIDDAGNVRPYVHEAKKRGVLFDVGHGGYGFWFSESIPALQQGLGPDTFGSDLHRFSMNSGMKSMLNIMSKYLSMKMSINEVIEKATWGAAQAIRHPELGNLSEGSIADITILNLLKGDYGFIDSGGNRINGNQKFEAELTIRAGKIVWDLNGLSAKPFNVNTK